MLEYNEITEHKFIVLDGTPYEVLSSHVFRKQQRKPVNATKLKNLLTGKTTEYSFHVSDKVEEADIENKEVKYLYKKPAAGGRQEEWWFCDIKDPSNRFMIPAEKIGDQGRFLKENSVVTSIIFDEDVIGMKLPIKVDLKVTEAPPSIKGDSSRAGNKVVTVETGASVNAPLFVEAGDTIRINTETGEYTDRIK